MGGGTSAGGVGDAVGPLGMWGRWGPLGALEPLGALGTLGALGAFGSMTRSGLTAEEDLDQAFDVAFNNYN